MDDDGSSNNEFSHTQGVPMIVGMNNAAAAGQRIMPDGAMSLPQQASSSSSSLSPPPPPPPSLPASSVNQNGSSSVDHSIPPDPQQRKIRFAQGSG